MKTATTRGGGTGAGRPDRGLTAQLLTHVTPVTRDALRGIADARGVPVSDVTREAIAEYIDRHRPRKITTEEEPMSTVTDTEVAYLRDLIRRAGHDEQQAVGEWAAPFLPWWQQASGKDLAEISPTAVVRMTEELRRHLGVTTTATGERTERVHAAHLRAGDRLVHAGRVYATVAAVDPAPAGYPAGRVAIHKRLVRGRSAVVVDDHDECERLA